VQLPSPITPPTLQQGLPYNCRLPAAETQGVPNATNIYGDPLWLIQTKAFAGVLKTHAPASFLQAKAFAGVLKPAYWQALIVVCVLYFARFDWSFVILRAKQVRRRSQLA